MTKGITNSKQRYRGAVDTITIRDEGERDHKVAKGIARKAFYNLYISGRVEHCLAHIARDYEDPISELDFVTELDGQAIGDIMYTKTRLVGGAGTEKEVLTFGLVSITPEYQRRGYGKMLIEHSSEQVVPLGCDVAVILGSPMSYVGCGFKSGRKLNICMENGKYSAAMMAEELVPSQLDGGRRFYYDSPAMVIFKEEVQEYDNTLEKMEEKYQPNQEESYIMNHAFIK